MILVIDNYDSFTYNIVQLLQKMQLAVMVVRNDKINLHAIQALAPLGIVLSPGPGRPEDAGICLDLIRKFSGQIPILGVCLGHQAIAIAFGGKVVTASEVQHGKASKIFHHRSPLYQDLPLPFSGGRYHSLIVDANSLTPQLTIEAETADELIMGIRHHEHPTFGVQFHPESILSEFGAKIIENFIAICHKSVTTTTIDPR